MNPAGNTSPQLRGPIRVTVPASVAYDLVAFQKGITALVERIGCRTCFSGADCTFQSERDWVISKELVATPTGQSLAADPAIASQQVTVSLAKEVRFDINQIHAAVAKVVGKLGCGACCSGFDIAFQDEAQFLTVSKELDVQANG